MSNRYYTSMVRHVLRYYCSHPEGPNRDRDCWLACDEVLSGLSDFDRDSIMRIYSERDPVPTAILRLSGADHKRLWNLVNFVERKIARKMGWA